MAVSYNIRRSRRGCLPGSAVFAALSALRLGTTTIKGWQWWHCFAGTAVRPATRSLQGFRATAAAPARSIVVNRLTV